MSLTLLKDKVGIECNRCGLERFWPQGFHGTFQTLQELQDFAAKRWGWTFDGCDLCDECSKEKR